MCTFGVGVLSDAGAYICIYLLVGVGVYGSISDPVQCNAIQRQVWTTVSDWLTGESREYVRRVALGPGEPQEAVLGTCMIVYKPGRALTYCSACLHIEQIQYTQTAALLSRPEAKGRRALLDARKREVALGQVLAPHLPPATDALRPLLADTAASSGVSPAMVTARVQGLLSTLDLARALPAFLSSKHVRAGV